MTEMNSVPLDEFATETKQDPPPPVLKIDYSISKTEVLLWAIGCFSLVVGPILGIVLMKNGESPAREIHFYLGMGLFFVGFLSAPVPLAVAWVLRALRPMRKRLDILESRVNFLLSERDKQK